MKKFIYILTATALALVSCNKAEMADSEMVTLEYNVTVPGSVTKATTIGDASHVDQLVCAVFENGVEHKALRKTIARNSDGNFSYTPSLYIGREYQIVFWAQKEDYYNLSYMTKVTWAKGYQTNDENADAFTATQSVKINPDKTVTVNGGTQTVSMNEMSVTLKRPFAKVCIRTKESDWSNDAVKSRITFDRIQTTFNALAGETVDSEFLSYQTYSADCIGKIDGEEYRYVSLNYLFPCGNVDITVEVLDKNGNVISSLTATEVPVNANYQTNVTSAILKGELNYTVEINPGFDTTDNKEIE